MMQNNNHSIQFTSDPIKIEGVHSSYKKKKDEHNCRINSISSSPIFQEIDIQYLTCYKDITRYFICPINSEKGIISNCKGLVIRYYWSLKTKEFIFTTIMEDDYVSKFPSNFRHPMGYIIS